MKRTDGPFLRTVFLFTLIAFAGCAGLRSSAADGALPQAEEAAESEEGPAADDTEAPVREGGESSGEAAAGTETAGAEPSSRPGPGAAETGAQTGAPAAGAPNAPRQEPSRQDAAVTADAGPAGEDAALPEEEPESEEGEEGEEGEGEEEEEGLSPEQKILEMDIKTSSLSELAAWCRSLELSEGGSKEQLAERLRNYYELPSPLAADQTAGSGKKEKKTIIIESARSTEYFTLETVDEEYARLKGDVVVSLKDGEASYRIKAEEILFNRTRNIISASGGVEFLKEDGDNKETFRGEQITVDLDNWASVFMDSVSERSSNTDDSVFRFSGSLITRNDEKATILTDAVITNGSEEESFWSINASKLWLLPGNDWAFLNGVLKVGEIPVLWLPAFFYPSDEIIFHPVFGYRSREGNFVQTTTYLFGRPKPVASSEASSITKIMGNSPDDEKEQQGIFLRSTGKKTKDPNDTRLAFLFDSYANLGIYTGTEFTLPPMGALRSLNVLGGIGFTRNVYQLIDGTYTPFPQSEGTSEWNTSRMFSETVPFRYRLDSAASFSLPGGSLSLSFPFYSDTYVNRDFMDRTEEMDWFNMIKQGNNTETETETDLTKNILGYYDWRISGSFTPRLDFLSPFISSLSISNISTTLAFRHRDSRYRSSTDVSPDRTFYYPDKFTLISVSAAISGTPLTLGGNRTSVDNTNEEAVEPSDLFKDTGTPYSPWNNQERDEDRDAGDSSFELKPPVLGSRFDVPLFGGPQFSVDYRLAPSGASEMQFRSSADNWPDAREVDWGDVSSVLNTVKADSSLGFTLQSSDNGLYTVGWRAYGNGAWQDYSMMNREAEEFDTVLERNSALRRNYNATYFTTTGESSVTVKPFFWNDVFSNTNFQYSVRGLLARSLYKDPLLAAGEEIGSPEYEIEYGEWTKEKLDSHRVGANVSASIMDYSQDLSMALELPPKDSSLNNSATMRVWISETSFTERINEPFDVENRLFLPMTFTETLRFAQNYTFSQNVIYDPELEDFTSLNSSLRLNYLRLTYTMSRFRPYEYDQSQGWIVKSNAEETFNPREFRIEYAQTSANQKFWQDRISFNINVSSSLSIDLQRYTYSRFLFNLGFTLGITKFLDISVTASSENAVVFRYIQDMPFFDLDEEVPGEKDALKDLLNSFRFDNDALRRSSGFKLKTFGLSLTHHLGDWNAKLDWRLSPYLDQTNFPYTYRFNSEISFIVQWIPISEAKTELTYNKDVFEIK